MFRLNTNGIVLYRFEGLEKAADVNHAVLTRIGGVSQGHCATLNLGHTVGDEPDAVDENHRRALGILDLEPQQVVSPHQVHGARVGIVGKEHLGTVQPATDALLTDAPDVPLLMRFGDCASVLLFDPVQRVIGLAHAGWRGVVAGVIEATVGTMQERYDSDPTDIWAGIGPTIGPCCYEVGADVAAQIEAACPPEANVVQRLNGRVHADLPAAVESQLRTVGVEHIEDSRLCTACRVDEFFSHRAEHGKTGRFGIVILRTGAKATPFCSRRTCRPPERYTTG